MDHPNRRHLRVTKNNQSRPKIDTGSQSNPKRGQFEIIRCYWSNNKKGRKEGGGRRRRKGEEEEKGEKAVFTRKDFAPSTENSNEISMRLEPQISPSPQNREIRKQSPKTLKENPNVVSISATLEPAARRGIVEPQTALSVYKPERTSLVQPTRNKSAIIGLRNRTTVTCEFGFPSYL
jgi:hypothetical protein